MRFLTLLLLTLPAHAMTPEQREVLAHVVVDPEAWEAHCMETLGDACQDALRKKVARWQSDYEAAKSDPDYQTRAERERNQP